MTAKLNIPKDPYREYDAELVARMALACLECDPAPCMLNCPQRADVPQVMRLARRAACEGLALPRWLLDEERLEAARVADSICDSYND